MPANVPYDQFGSKWGKLLSETIRRSRFGTFWFPIRSSASHRGSVPCSNRIELRKVNNNEDQESLPPNRDVFFGGRAVLARCKPHRFRGVQQCGRKECGAIVCSSSEFCSLLQCRGGWCYSHKPDGCRPTPNGVERTCRTPYYQCDSSARPHRPHCHRSA